MKKTHTSAASTTLSAASLGTTHGYQLDGDTVTLNAEILRRHDEARASDWRMQLWACPEPFSGGHLQGTKVADLSLGALDAAPAHITASGLATPPANAHFHNMVMVLASQESGKFATIHDYANYPLQQAFALPRMLGQVGYRFVDERVQIHIEALTNPRTADNLSGTLSLELWAMPQPYTGGDFTGTALAGVSIGQLAGQSVERNLSFDLPRNQIVANHVASGQAHLVLMLREWTAAGYVTRDYACFAEPIEFAAPAQPTLTTPKQTQEPAKAQSAASTKALSAMLSSVKPSAKKHANKAANASEADAPVDTTPSKEEVLRSRGRGRKLLAKLSAVAKNDSRKQPSAK